jgi:flavin reductase (DIM6/NTAB) family NADH-FMN oxidoreductase RutF
MPEFKTISATKIGAPLIAGARASLECKLVSRETVGDHTVFYGEVLRFEIDEAKKPLVLFSGGYYSLGEKRGEYP